MTKGTTIPDIDRIIAGLTEAQRMTIHNAEMLVDGRVLIPSYSVPDHLTRIYSVHRSALNRVGLAVRAALQRQERT